MTRARSRPPRPPEASPHLQPPKPGVWKVAAGGYPYLTFEVPQGWQPHIPYVVQFQVPASGDRAELAVTGGDQLLGVTLTFPKPHDHG